MLKKRIQYCSKTNWRKFETYSDTTYENTRTQLHFYF